MLAIDRQAGSEHGRNAKVADLEASASDPVSADTRSLGQARLTDLTTALAPLLAACGVKTAAETPEHISCGI